MWWRDGLWLAGIDTTAHTFEEASGSRTHGVRLPAGTIPAVLRDSAAVAVDQRLELSQVLTPSTVARLTDAFRSWPDERGGLLVAVSRLLQEAPVDGDAVRASRLLVAASARGVPVAETARELGWSPRRLHRFAVTTFGVSPVMLRQLVRLRRARRLLASGRAATEAATIAGYSDQAHLTREVVRFTGMTPARLHAGQRAPRTHPGS
nr:AraC family transcriptional regulator [Auraticoccus cholistanensis]